jgi:hypothetical protein
MAKLYDVLFKILSPFAYFENYTKQHGFF